MSWTERLRHARKGLLAVNAAIVIRALRFGVADAKARLLRAYGEIDPFSPQPATELSVESQDLLPDHPATEWGENTEWDETVALRPETAGPLSYNKVCNLHDFRHPVLIKWIREVYPHEIRRFGPQFPVAFEDRRQWEIAMTIRTLADHGAIHDRSRILGVGVGNEPTIFYLTNHVAQVFATDLYVQPNDGWAEADHSMLTDPGLNAPYAWNPRRLVTQHMDARELRYEDESFDAIFSSGSIEHFGTLDEIERSVDEMYRVLKPGGILALTTEYRIEGPDFGSVGLMFFTPELIEERLIGKRDWSLLSPYDFTISEETRHTEFSQADAVAVFMAHIERHGRLLYHKYRQAKYPMIVMRQDLHVWTSVSLALRKS
jgi:SAM-dependent methyltransferase